MELQRWITVRQMEEIPKTDYYDFYKENGGECDFEDFSNLFDRLVTNGSYVNTSSGVKHMNTEIAKRKIIEFYDSKFALC